MNRKTLVLPAVVGLLAPVLVACGDSKGGASGGGTIVVGTTDQITGGKDNSAPLDPAHAYDTGAWNVLRPSLQTLMRTPHGGGLPTPEAAESCSFTDNASQSFRCKLRSGLKFADGTAVTAEDVKFSIERVRAIDSDNGTAGLLSTVDKIETKGDHDVVFHLSIPDATFPFKLSTPVASIVSKKKYEGKKLRDGFQVDGSGPYTMKATVKDNRISKVVFSRNESYKGDIKVLNKKVEMRVFSDAKAMGQALETGEIDVMTREMSPEQIKTLTTNRNKDIELVEMPGLSIRYLAFNTADPSVKDKAVRQAMASVIDRGQLAGQVYGSAAEPLYSLIPASIGAHKNSFYNEYGEPSVEKAEKILKKAGIRTPVKLKLHYTTDRYGAGTAREFEVLRSQLNKSGLFQVTVQGAEWSAFRAAQKRGEYPVYGMGWFPDFPDPDNYIAPFLDKDNFLNSPYVSNEIRSLIPQSRRHADRTAAAGAFSTMQDIVADDVPVLPLWQGRQYVAARKGVGGIELLLNSTSDLQIWELRAVKK
ncbi:MULTISPECIES: ABC transporter substrate-binding protein [Streptomyces]|uniref:Peptide-binding protein n=1 Tax=Streptomyces tsukubensis (strain DSM 42081 / NBRC 108919 / NRRL 18488 / 9993) TaxID=1114943 RepID=A0A7G3ULM2_STRT9|nr:MULTISPECIES: ABC transporter substrate-binding protein [Streptomyces]AZK93305.1 peptide-binding protein [Streptomyces tsukubensis]MYS63040.1 peptide-binding protein [Streptomyces sp. SID5473]QKM70541.1 peptide-binding protein [Streptomyces tsukubensis NRRL18488]TAI40554.1 peptide-binding protein [Streptomyces tsukubensis]